MRSLCVLTLVILGSASIARAQPSNFDFLRRMDANRNGRLEPNEISDRARSYLERFTRDAGISLSRSVSIGEIESAARRYYERRRDDSNRGGSSSSSSSSSSFGGSSADVVVGVRGFGPDEDTPLIPGFGPDVDIRQPFIAADEERAKEIVRRYDRNQDGGIDRSEAEGGRWSDNPFIYDYNEDGLLSVIELAQRYARRRIAEAADRNSRSSSSRNSNEGDRSPSDDRRSDERSYDRGDPRRWGYGRTDDGASGAPDRRTYELAYSIVARHDRNRNGNLERPEWVRAGENFAQADEDRNGQITRGELATWLSRDIQRKNKDFSADLPPWFFELDQNNDHQISMAEYTEEWNAAKLDEFAGFDRNGDGFLTEKELLGSKSAVGGSYTNEKAMVILPAGSITSDIVVDEDYLIGDLDVQLSITHTNAAQLNAYLIGPDTEQIELFTGVGRSDDHFDGTILDDEASERITRARPPFRGRFVPEAVEKKGTSLRHYYGKSIKGQWRLEIRTSNGDRPGMLHGWSLIVRRPEELDSDKLPDEEGLFDDRESSARENEGEFERDRPPGFGERSYDRGGGPSFGEGRPSFRGGYPGGGPRGPWPSQGGPPQGERGRGDR